MGNICFPALENINADYPQNPGSEWQLQAVLGQVLPNQGQKTLAEPPAAATGALSARGFTTKGSILAFGDDCLSGCSAPGTSLLLSQTFSHEPADKMSLALTTDLRAVLLPLHIMS